MQREKIFTEKEVEEISDKILKKSIDKITHDLSHNFYDELNGFLYEHYQNVSKDIENDLISKITEDFIERPSDYKFLNLRKKIFNENKEKIIPILTEEAILNSLENIIWKHIDKNYHFSWKWTESIAGFILNNWNKLKSDERINNHLLNEIEKLKEKNRTLQTIINSQDD